MPAIVENDINGYVVPVEEQLFYEKLVILMEDESKHIFAERLFMTVVDKFGENKLFKAI
jgi:hypothetical protein